MTDRRIPFKRHTPKGTRIPHTTLAISRRMGNVRRASTQPELTVRKVASALKLGFRIRNRDLPGSPDLANRRRRFAIFVHGCFWHRHARCPKCTTPKSNVDFWKEKFSANQVRDRAAVKRLIRSGFRVVVIWECQTRDVDALRRTLSILRD